MNERGLAEEQVQYREADVNWEKNWENKNLEKAKQK
jgi:hypothetical protein